MIKWIDKCWDVVWKCVMTNSRWWSLLSYYKHEAQRRQTLSFSNSVMWSYLRTPLVIVEQQHWWRTAAGQGHVSEGLSLSHFITLVHLWQDERRHQVSRCPVALLVASWTNNRYTGSRPTIVVCITVLTGNRLGWTVRCGRPPLFLPSCKKLEFKTVSVDGLGSGMGKWCEL